MPLESLFRKKRNPNNVTRMKAEVSNILKAFADEFSYKASDYPSQRSDAVYRRTNALAEAWVKGGQDAKVDDSNGELSISIINSVRETKRDRKRAYARYVQGDRNDESKGQTERMKNYGWRGKDAETIAEQVWRKYSKLIKGRIEKV